mgnify:FL=1
MIIEKFTVRQANGKRNRTKIKIKCTICQGITETFLDNYSKSTKKDNWVCRKCSAPINGKNGQGKKKGKKYKNLQGKNSPRWKGGRYINSQGYVMIFINEDGRSHNSPGFKAYRKEHTVVAERELGRSLTKEECVHHIDGNRQNNDWSNLAVINSNGHHKLCHDSLQKIGYELVKAKLIFFDHKTCEYKAYDKLRELLETPKGQSAAEPEMEGSTTRRKPTSTEQ